MPTMEPAEVMRSWFERVWNQGDDSAIDELMSPVCIAHGLAGTAGGVLKGPGEFKPFAREFRAAFPNIKIIVTRTVTEGDYCAAGCEVRGTHTGQGLGLSPTGRDVFFCHAPATYDG